MSSEIVIKFLVAAVLAGTPFLFGTVGEILSEKVGHLNLGVEGMMSIGACAGFMVGYQTDNFVAALLAAAVAGMLSALIYGVLTVTFMANQNVTGLTLTIFGVGLSNFIGVFMLEKSENGTLKLPDAVTAQMRNIHIPGLSDLPVVGELLFSYNPFVYLGIIIAIVASFYLYKTQVGLNVQAIGENPGAADAACSPSMTSRMTISPCLPITAIRCDLRYRRRILLDDHKRRRVAARQRRRSWLDLRCPRYLRGMEAGQCYLRFLYFRGAARAEILCAEKHVCDSDGIFRCPSVHYHRIGAGDRVDA